MARTKQTSRPPYSREDGKSDNEASDYSSDEDISYETYMRNKPFKDRLWYLERRHAELIDNLEETKWQIEKITTELKRKRKRWY